MTFQSPETDAARNPTLVDRPRLEAEPDTSLTTPITAPSVERRHGRIRASSGSKPNPTADVIRIADTIKRFGDVDALHSLNFNVPEGRITVLLGPNGAGKTTAIRLITGALVPDEGTVRVFGLDPGGPDGEQVRTRCGVVSAKPSLYDRLSGIDNLRYAAELYGMGRGPSVDKRVVEAADQFGIAADLDQRVGGYSTGMKTRLALARAVLHQPSLMLLDEPTSGLDPESAVAVLAMVRDMTSEGKTVLMCTHLLLEAERLADQIVVMDQGHDLLAGDPDELSTRFWPRATVEITATGGHGLDHLVGMDGVTDVQRNGTHATVEIDRHDRTPELVGALTAAGTAVESVVPYHPSLEDLYFAIRARYGPASGDQSDQLDWRRRAPAGYGTREDPTIKDTAS